MLLIGGPPLRAALSPASAWASRPSRPARVCTVGARPASPAGVNFLQGHATLEVADRQAAVGAGVPIGRQDVIGAAAIVAHRFRRPGAKENRTGAAGSAPPSDAARRPAGSGARARSDWRSRWLSSRSGTSTAALCASACRMMSRRGRAGSAASISRRTLPDELASVVTSITWESGPCSAWDSRSRATKRGLAPASAITMTSDGPAGMSSAAPAGSMATACLAAVTQALPGPKILSTLGMLSVP